MDGGTIALLLIGIGAVVGSVGWLFVFLRQQADQRQIEAAEASYFQSAAEQETLNELLTPPDQIIASALWALSEGPEWSLKPHAYLPEQTVPGVRHQKVDIFGTDPFANLVGLDDLRRTEWKVYMFGATTIHSMAQDFFDEERFRNATFLDVLNVFYPKVMGHYGAAAVFRSWFRATLICISRERAYVLIFPVAVGASIE